MKSYIITACSYLTQFLRNNINNYVLRLSCRISAYFSLFFITMVRKKNKKRMEKGRSISEIDFENKFNNFFE